MNICLVGYGKMGKAIEQLAVEGGHHIARVIGSSNSNDLNTQNLVGCDVAIEFSTPATAVSNLLKCFDAGLPVVCGTTGWQDREENVKQACNDKRGALLATTNFSVGVNIFFALNAYLGAMMSKYDNYDVSITETHHTQKKDSPSGTAITLAGQILNNSPSKNKWVNHPATDVHELSIVSRRVDPAAGTHNIKYSSYIDDIEITHTAHNREGFARGAILAAEFIKGKTGIFSMKEVLGL